MPKMDLLNPENPFNPWFSKSRGKLGLWDSHNWSARMKDNIFSSLVSSSIEVEGGGRFSNATIPSLISSALAKFEFQTLLQAAEEIIFCCPTTEEITSCSADIHHSLQPYPQASTSLVCPFAADNQRCFPLLTPSLQP